MIYTDFAKAFDKCDFSVIGEEMISHKISGKVGRWIFNFLTQRSFKVILNNTTSKEEKVTSSVPQGAILAPILFLLLINDIGEDLNESDVQIFADDTKVSKSTKSKEDEESLQHDTTKLGDWATRKNMEFNKKKFKHLRHSLDDRSDENIYKTSDGNFIERVKKTKDLGTIMTANVSFRDDHERSKQKASQKMGWALRTFESRDKTTLLTLFKSQVLPHLEYNSILTRPDMKKDITDLERVQGADSLISC